MKITRQAFSALMNDVWMQAEAQLEIDLAQGTCALQADTVLTILTLKQVEDNAKEGQNSTVLSETLANLVPSYAGGEWSLFFANCQKPSVVSFDARVEMYNMHNGLKDYLSVGEDMIPAVYLVGAAMHLLACHQILFCICMQNHWAGMSQCMVCWGMPHPVQA